MPSRACKTVVRAAVAAALAGALAGCGGEDKGRPSGDPVSGEALDPCGADDGYEFLSLLDFEPYGVEPNQARCNPDLEIGTSPNARCSFYFNYDLAHSVNPPDLQALAGAGDCVMKVREDQAVSRPRAADGNFFADPIEGGRCGAEGSGFHVTARNIGMCIGSNGRLGWGASADITFATPLDAGAWDGIALWVRRGGGSSGEAIILSVVDPYTSGATDPETLRAHCDASEAVAGAPPVPDSAKCDAFGAALTLTDDWTFVPARFDRMQQKGFGVRSPFGRVDASRLTRLQILMTAGDWDIWIDDVALFRRPE